MHYINKYQVEGKEFTFIEVIQDDIKVTLMDYGATIMSIFTPDKNGKYETIVLAYESLGSYINGDIYMNATIGPNSGRIKNATFTLNEEVFELDKNSENTNLHGGKDAYSFKFFDYEISDSKEYTKVAFSLHVKDEEQNYPGTVDIKVIYTIKRGELLVEFIGNTDKDTLLNMTNHAYFNLSGNIKRDILGHHLYLNADRHIALDEESIPYRVENCLETRLDFTEMKELGSHFGVGLDTPYLLNECDYTIPQAIVWDPETGRELTVYTTYEAMVVYTHMWPDTEPFMFGAPNQKFMAICLEAEHAPNGINIDGLHDSILKKEDTYHEKILYKFSVKK